MSIAWLDDRFLPLEEARVPVLDRGFLFADGVYEVIPVYGGRPFRLDPHLDRLGRSLEGIRLADPLPRPRWRALVQELVERNGGGDLSVYLQVTRGAAPRRQHAFPERTRPTVLAFCQPLEPPPAALLEHGVAVVTLEDIRWRHCHLKTIALLPNVLLYETARAQGAYEAVLARDGLVTECASANLFAVIDGTVHTPPLGDALLPGITRELVLALAAAEGLACREAPLPRAALEEAEELWLSSSTREVLPITRIDGRPVGEGRPGPAWRRVWTAYQAHKVRVARGEAD